MFSGPYAGAGAAMAITPMAGIFFIMMSSVGMVPSLAIQRSRAFSEQLVLARVEILFQLSAPEHEHSPEFLHGDSGHELFGLRQGEPGFLQGDGAG